MSRPPKLARFQEFSALPNAFEYTTSKGAVLRGQWHDLFKNNHPIVLELGCGRGEYTLALARLFPDQNFIGIDIQGERLWYGATEALAQDLSNVRFLRMYIDHLEDFFAPGEVSELWITFPDPHPTKKGAKKRLTHPRFLERYKKVLKPRGTVHVKTDSPLFYESTMASVEEVHGTILEKSADVYAAPGEHQLLKQVQTNFEKKHLNVGRTIHYLRFSL